LMRAGTIVDATIIAAPSSTKNADNTRDPEMHQTKKGNQWHLGMKAHIGVDAQSGLVHTVVGTAANVSDINVAGALLHGEEHAAFGDAGYQGVHKRVEAKGPTWHVAMRRGKRSKLNEFMEPQFPGRACGEDEGEHPGQGRASVPRDQEPVPSQEDALQGAGQEHRTAVQLVRSGQSGHRQEVAVGLPCPRCVLNAEKQSKRCF
jgi:hypothetical protein